jgi:hypothetical protein
MHPRKLPLVPCHLSVNLYRAFTFDVTDSHCNTKLFPRNGKAFSSLTATGRGLLCLISLKALITAETVEKGLKTLWLFLFKLPSPEYQNNLCEHSYLSCKNSITY